MLAELSMSREKDTAAVPFRLRPHVTFEAFYQRVLTVRTVFLR
jgi:hypothetical protein